MSALVYSLLSVIVISLLSLVGIAFFKIKQKKLEKVLIYFVSFSTGAFFGDIFFHLLPELVESNGFSTGIGFSVIIGILTSFVLEKFIHWRHCHSDPKTHAHPFALMSLVGDFLHNFIDGLIISASFLVNVSAGFATSIAVMFHELPQELGDFAVLLHGGFTKKRALKYNFLTSLSSVLGVLVTFIIGSKVANLSSYLIPFAIGNFLYIAGSDLIPELHKQTNPKQSFYQTLLLISGILVMFSLTLLE